MTDVAAAPTRTRSCALAADEACDSGVPRGPAPTPHTPGPLLAMLEETLRNLDAEHRARLDQARLAARDPALGAGIAAGLARRHAERRAPYVDAIGRLSAAAREARIGENPATPTREFDRAFSCR